jgi:hypothetical protein
LEKESKEKEAVTRLVGGGSRCALSVVMLCRHKSRV